MVVMMIARGREHVHVLVDRHETERFVHVQETQQLAAELRARHAVREEVNHVISVHHEVHECPHEVDVLRRLFDVVALHQTDEDEHGRLEQKENDRHAHDHHTHAFDLAQSLQIFAVCLIFCEQHLHINSVE